MPFAPIARNSRTRRRLVLAAAALSSALVVVTGNVAAASTGSVGDASSPSVQPGYVALGDSYTSGPGLEGQTDTNCARSDRNYPSLLAESLRPAAFKDASCSGATTVQMWQAQGTNPPQIDALSADTSLVTVGIGGNDIGFSGIIRTCLGVAQSDPAGHPCQSRFTASGTDELAARVDATGPKIAAVLAAVRERSPRARVVVVGYPSLVPDSGVGCPSTVPFAEGDFGYLRDTLKRLNGMLAEQATTAGAGYADTYRGTVGHDMCQAPADRWVEGPTPASPAAPFHPNARGHIAMAAAVMCPVAHGQKGTRRHADSTRLAG